MNIEAGAPPDDYVAWLEEECRKAEADADKLRADALNALCADADNCNALFDAESRADGMAKAFRAATMKARLMQRLYRRIIEPKPEPAPEPLTVLGAAVANGHLGVLVLHGKGRALLLPNGSRVAVDSDAAPLVGASMAQVGGLLRQHDEARNALDGAA